MPLYDYYNKKDKNAYANQRILGPSFALTVGRSSFGIVTGTRMVMSTRNVPYDIAKFIFEKLGKVDLEKEKSFMDEILTHDSKNYHLWSYRTWLCERFGFWEHEMKFINSILPLDLLNNSFWSYRHFLTSHLKQPLEEEKAVCETAIETNPKNESAWNYYSSLFQNECLDEKALEFTEKIAKNSNSHFPLRALFFHHLNSEQPDSKKMTQLIEDLNKTAPERSAYWTHLASRIKN